MINLDFFKKQFLENKNKVILFIILFILLTVFFIVKYIYYRPYIEYSPFCQEDKECALYECSKCGNIYWLKENGFVDEDCSSKISGLVGCECKAGKCVREYR
ncbi:MAG: hypothetical protein U9Q85_00555 [Patescibacteria group bacterium]|nr:hypothetical protein [Patescibacteria group bacterium]